MDISNLSGVIPPVVTPLDENKNFDKQSFANVINRLIDSGVDGLFILGSTGSVVFLTGEQCREVIKAAVEIVDGRVPILAGVIYPQTNGVIRNIKFCEELGVDGVVATAPFYALDDDTVVENHFRLLRESTKLPIFAYDLPVCVHKKLKPDMLIRLGCEGVLQGVKDSSGDDVSFRILLMKNEEAGGPLRVFTGHEVVVDGALLAGADGVVPGLGNVDPKVYVDMYKASAEGRWNDVKILQDKAARLMEIVFRPKKVEGFSSGVGGFVTALMLMDIIKTNNVCNPSIALEGQDVENVRSILIKEGLL